MSPRGKFWSFALLLHGGDEDNCLRIPRIPVEMRWMQFGGRGVGAKQPCRALTRLFLFVVVMWSGVGAQCWCSVWPRCCRFKWEVLKAVMANDLWFSSPDCSLSLTAHLGKPQKPPWASPRSWRAHGSRRKLQRNALLGCGSLQKTKKQKYPSKTCK